MRPNHLFLALLVVLTWGINFAIVRIGLNGFPPLLLCTARFLFVVFPAIFFLPRPRASWTLLCGYGLTNFALQFAFVFTGIWLGMSPGLASLVLQMQAFFTIGLASLVFKEKPGAWKLVGAAIAFSGIVVVGRFSAEKASLAGLGLTLLAALSWAAGNVFSKKIQAISPLALVVWGSLVALPAMAALSVCLEGPALIGKALASVSWTTVGAVAYLVVLSTHFCYSVWGYLMGQYATATIAPFTLLVPVFGFLGSSALLGEDFPAWKLGASCLVIFGLSFNLLESRILAWIRA